MSKIRVAVVGAGQFGRNHVRVARESTRSELVAVVDTDPARAHEAAAGCLAFTDYRELRGCVDAAIIAAPTIAHAEIGCELMQAGIDVLVEKPIAADLESAGRLIETARASGRILQVGHLERYNPAVLALEQIVTHPLFFEIHRMNLFSPRSLDVDIVLDLMIHDLDIVLHLVGAAELEEIRAAGVSILSEKVDIGNVRLQFRGGCVANLTASRVSQERVRKVRFFSSEAYISVDTKEQEVKGFQLGNRAIEPIQVRVEKKEPLRAELESFLQCVRDRKRPLVSGEDGVSAVALAKEVAAAIEASMRKWRR